ncbi:hypothetical protein ABEB36_008200 [Hypothenemus hampei]|uniref:Uncharacterized protein n=1 Tax=Hypothenemus hampei TaxID=57062 RepID=A0ABD1ENA1_HYPHA
MKRKKSLKRTVRSDLEPFDLEQHNLPIAPTEHLDPDLGEDILEILGKGQSRKSILLRYARSLVVLVRNTKKLFGYGGQRTTFEKMINPRKLDYTNTAKIESRDGSGSFFEEFTEGLNKRQELLGVCIEAIGQTISSMLTEEETRNHSYLSLLNSSRYLVFGEDLEDRIKAVKSFEKSSQNLRLVKPKVFRKSLRPLNSRGSTQATREQGPPIQ